MSRELDISITIFATPCRDLPISKLVETVSPLGFSDFELPVRASLQVTPEAVDWLRPEAVRILADASVVIDIPPRTSSALIDHAIEACAASTVRSMRVACKTAFGTPSRIRSVFVNRFGHVFQIRSGRSGMTQKGPDRLVF